MIPVMISSRRAGPPLPGLGTVTMGSAAGRWIILVSILGSGLAGIDATVVNVALPAIGGSLGAGFTGLQWTVTAYTLTLAAFILLGGSLADRFGRRRIFIVGVVWFGARLAIAGDITVGQLVAFYGYTGYLAEPMRQVTFLFTLLTRARVAVDKTTKVLAVRPAAGGLGDADEAPAGLRPLATTEPILTDADSQLAVAADRFTVLVAEDPDASAAIARRLARMSDADAAGVCLAGRPITSYPLAEVRHRVVLAEATPQLFSGTLRSQVDAREDAAEQDVWAALAVADAHDVTQTLGGLQGKITEKGRSLSGGQRQRVALARAVLTEAEVARYARTISLQGMGTPGQRRLKSARVCVVGAGGLGGPVLQYLAGAGVGHITVVDDDVVELKNLQRQTLFGHSTIGHGKADAAVARLRDLNDLIDIEPCSTRVTVDTAAEIFAGHDLVVDAVDNLPTRLVTADACQALDMPFVWGAVQAVNGQVSVFWERLGLGLRDLFPRPPAEMPKVDDVGVLGPMTGWVGSVMATECVKVITGIGDPLLGRVMYIDTLGARVSELPLKGRQK